MSGILTIGSTAILAVRGEESKTGDPGPGLTAFLIVAALAVATFFLLRSMLGHINKVPPTFDPPEEPPSSDASSPPDDPPPFDASSPSSESSS